MLVSAKYQCKEAASGVEALAILDAGEKFDLMLSDLMMANLDGIGLLEKIKEAYPDMAVIMVTAVHDISVAFAAIRNGAYDYLLKPFEREQLMVAVRRALEYRRLKFQNHAYQTKLKELGFQAKESNQSVLQAEAESQETAAARPETRELPSKLSSVNTNSQRRHSAVLSSLHDLNNEFLVMGAAIGRLQTQAASTDDIIEEINTIDTQLNNCKLVLHRLLSNYFGLRSAKTSWGGARKNIGSDHKLRDARHAINGSFLVIGFTLTGLREWSTESIGAVEEIENLAQSLQRCEDLLQHTRVAETQSKIDAAEADSSELQIVLEKVMSVVRRRLTLNVTVNVNYDNDIKRLSTSVPADQLVNILVEIITNAIKALQPDGGVVRVSAEKIKNDAIRFVVEDNGPGMPLHVRTNLLKKSAPGRSGLGIGLYLCREIVRQFGGKFVLESAACSKGTRVVIVMPLQPRKR